MMLLGVVLTTFAQAGGALLSLLAFPLAFLGVLAFRPSDLPAEFRTT